MSKISDALREAPAARREIADWIAQQIEAQRDRLEAAKDATDVRYAQAMVEVLRHLKTQLTEEKKVHAA